MRTKKVARLLYGATDIGAPYFSADILWRTGFHAPDPFFLAEIADKAMLFASPLEAGRADKEAAVDRVIRTDKKGCDAVTVFLKKRGIRRVEIPADFPYAIAEVLKRTFFLRIGRGTRERGLAGTGSLRSTSDNIGSGAWYPERAKKNAREVREIEKAQRATERAFDASVVFLRECRVKRKLLYHGGRPATSEMARKIIDDALWRDGYLATDTIAASGIQAADPHCIGRGVLHARVPIVIDIFPMSLRTHYYADMTRTVFKGEPPQEYKKMYEAVLTAQEGAIKKIRPGADGKEIYDGVHKHFSAEGYPTRLNAKRPEGFIHGLGHGVGIEIHEHPRLGNTREVLEEGNVVTVEPGLYYPRRRRGIPAGGIRIEDMALVTKTGCRNLTRSPKDLASAIIL